MNVGICGTNYFDLLLKVFVCEEESLQSTSHLMVLSHFSEYYSFWYKRKKIPIRKELLKRCNILAHTSEKSRGFCHQTLLDSETQINLSRSSPILFICKFYFPIDSDISSDLWHIFPHIMEISHQHPLFLTTTVSVTGMRDNEAVRGKIGRETMQI